MTPRRLHHLRARALESASYPRAANDNCISIIASNLIQRNDLNDNMISGAGRTVTYTAFNMTASIAQGTTTLTYDYDGEHGRIQQVAPEGTTVYVADPCPFRKP